MPTTCRWREAPVPSSSLCKSAGRAWKVPIDSPELSGSTSREDAGSGLPVEGDAEPPEPSAFRRKSSVSCCVACALRVRPPREVDSISVAGGSLGSSLDLGPHAYAWDHYGDVFGSLQFKSHFSGIASVRTENDQKRHSKTKTFVPGPNRCEIYCPLPPCSL
jgi:hypothetical protein